MAGIGNVSFNPLNRANAGVGNSIKKISTGSNNPSASYGASEYAITRRMTSNIGAYEQSVRNTQNSNALLNTAAGAVNNTVESLTTLRENIMNAMNGTNNSSDLATIQKSIGQTISQINENASVTYNGQRLIDGSNPGTTVAGSFGYETVSLGDMTSKGLGLTNESGDPTVNVADESTSLAGALEVVDKALNDALDQATSIGAAQQGLSYQEANYTTASENLQASESQIDDLDIAAETVKLKSNQTQEQLALFGIKAQMNMKRDTVANLLSRSPHLRLFC
jgi:flagellin